MTTRDLGYDDNHWTGQVVSVADADQEGKVQVRRMGLDGFMNDDGTWDTESTTNIPDEDLLWAKPSQDITSAAQNKMGEIPVGLVKGSIIHGDYEDPNDMQILVMHGSVAKAGDPRPDGLTVNGQLGLIDGTNGCPIGGRCAVIDGKKQKTNKFVTRKGRSIKDDDALKGTVAPEQNDSDGADVTAEAKANTKFGTQGTVGSIPNPVGSILTQIAGVDPQKLNSVLPNAVDAYTKIKDLNSFSSIGGVNGVLGQALGMAMNALGTSRAAQAIGSALNASSLSSTALTALQTAIGSLGSNPVVSSTVFSVIAPSVANITNQLGSMINSGTLNSGTFNSLMQQEQSNIQTNGAQATIGTNMNTVMSMLSSVLPQISGAINSVTQGHLPKSVLNNQTLTDALTKFVMNQTFVKKPGQGKKDLAKRATSNPKTNSSATAVQSLPNVTTDAKENLAAMAAYSP
jgi:hypothetical protein